MRVLRWLEARGWIERGRRKSSLPLPRETRRCKKCGDPGMYAVEAFLGGWSHRETIFAYKCPACGHRVTVESHGSFHRGIVYFFLFLELVVFFFDDSPSYPVYILCAAFFAALLYLFRPER